MGASDAYRHIVGQALYARKFGETIAEAMGNYNEWKFSEQDREVYKEESDMDRKNNAIGLEIARKAKTEEDVYRMAQEAIKNKEAIYYDNETADKKRLETDRKKASMLN
jgi:predicted RNase H-like HicB family nuclease